MSTIRSIYDNLASKRSKRLPPLPLPLRFARNARPSLLGQLWFRQPSERQVQLASYMGVAGAARDITGKNQAFFPYTTRHETNWQITLLATDPGIPTSGTACDAVGCSRPLREPVQWESDFIQANKWLQNWQPIPVSRFACACCPKIHTDGNFRQNLPPSRNGHGAPTASSDPPSISDARYGRQVGVPSEREGIPHHIHLPTYPSIAATLANRRSWFARDPITFTLKQTCGLLSAAEQRPAERLAWHMMMLAMLKWLA